MRRRQTVEIQKPTEDDLYEKSEKLGAKINYAEGHVLNTPKALQNVKPNVTAFCFSGTSSVFMYIGYGDGLICFWEITNNLAKVAAP